MGNRHFIFLFCLVLLPLSLGAQPAGVTTRYVYDANGRLRAVVTPEGAAIYEYDPAGNFTRIRRLNPTDCEVLEFAPRQAAFGTQITLYGVGLTTATGVTFNGKPAEIVSKSATTIITKVPDGAESGPLTITLPCGTKTLSPAFIVSGVRVAPATIAVSPNRTVRYTAIVAGVTDPSVVWSVGGIPGGNETVGTITESGVYTAPAQAPSTSATQVIRATSIVEPALFGEAQARVTGSGFEFLAQGVSVRYGTPPNLVVAYAATPVAVRYGPPDTKGAAFVATPVAVRYGEPDKSALTYVAQPVSVLYPVNVEKPTGYVVNPVSVQYGLPHNTAAGVALSLVSVTKAASITSLSITSFKRGNTVTLSLQGKNFSPESDVQFLRQDGEADAELRVTEIRVSADGTTLKAKVSVSEAAPVGSRIVRVMTSFGAASGPSNRANTIEIFP
jgi:YD repeat-containing protein